MLNSKNISKVKSILENANSVSVITHHNPDGDAVGSLTGLGGFLLKVYPEKEINLITPNDFPEFLKWIPLSNQIIVADKKQKKANEILLSSDVIFCLDFNTASRVKDCEQPLRDARGKKITIDHHLQPEEFVDVIISDTSSSSTCQLVYEFAENMQWEKALTQDIASSLYTGIMTDTGSFRFDSCTSKTHHILSKLLNTDFKKSMVHENVFDTNSENRLKLLGKCLYEKMEIFNEFKTAFFSISAADHDFFKIQKGDTEGFVNYGLSIKGIIFSVLFIEREEEIKISFRSKGDFDVNDFARKHFNGGGHKNAAGGISNISLDHTIIKFIEILKEYKNVLKEI